jgi:hypothetical protein
VTAKVQDWVASQSTKRNAKYDEPFTKKEMERAVADLPTYTSAADLKVSSSKRVGASQTAPEASELGMGTGDPAHSVVAGVIVNLFKAGDTAARELQGITLVSICKMFMLRKRMGPKCTCTRLRRRSEAKDPAQTTCSCSRASSRGWQGQQNCLCVLSGRAQSV